MNNIIDNVKNSEIIGDLILLIESIEKELSILEDEVEYLHSKTTKYQKIKVQIDIKTLNVLNDSLKKMGREMGKASIAAIDFSRRMQELSRVMAAPIILPVQREAIRSAIEKQEEETRRRLLYGNGISQSYR